MSILDGILGKVTEHVDVGNLAAKIGLNANQVEGAIASLAKSHGEEGDTVALAAEKTGIEPGKLSQIVEQIGGEGSLGQFSELLKSDEGMMAKVTGFLDRDGDGNPLNDLAGMAKGLFGNKS